MNIYLTHDEDLESFKRFFYKHNVELLPEDYGDDIQIDLLVFPGGADVHPSFHGGPVQKVFYDKERDKKELDILGDVRDGDLPVKKVLGVCRGMQLLNVGFGGSLIPDIAERCGQPHSAIHSLTYHNRFIWDFLTTVNSLHHQAVDYVGDRHRFHILASEPKHGIIESVCWSDKYFSVQWHPEYWREVEQIDRMVNSLELWVKGEISILGKALGERVKIQW